MATCNIVISSRPRKFFFWTLKPCFFWAVHFESHSNWRSSGAISETLSLQVMFIFVSPPAKFPCCRIDSTPLCNRGFLGSLQGSCLMFVIWLMSAFLMKIWMENGELIGNSLDVLPCLSFLGMFCDERGMEKTWKNPPAMRRTDGFYLGKSGKTPHFNLTNGMMIPSMKCFVKPIPYIQYIIKGILWII